MATFEELMAKSREFHAAGDLENAKRVAEIAMKMRKTPAKKSFGQVLKENLLGDDDPTTQNFGEKVGTFLNKGGESMTLGLVGDEASAAVESLMPGVNYTDRRDHYRQQEEILERENPGWALAADIGGGVVAPVGAIGALGKGAGLLSRALASGAGTATMGGLYGFMEGEGLEDRRDDALSSGGLAGALGLAFPFVGAGVQKLANARAGTKAIRAASQNAPTTEELKAAGRALYQEIDAAGVSLRPDAVRRGMDNITAGLRGEGVGFVGADRVLPASRAVMDAAEEVAGGVAEKNTVPLQEMDILRRYIGSAAGSNLNNKADTRAATMALGQLDDFMARLGADDVDAGDIETVQRLIPKAREVWSKMSRSQTIDDAIESSENYLSGQASGIRNQFARIVKSDKLSKGFSDAELKIMRRVVNGSLPEQVIHLLSGGIGQIATIAGATAAGGIGGLPGVLAGGAAGVGAASGLRRLSEGLSRKQAETVRAIIANGGIKALPKAGPERARLIEQLLRQATAVSSH